MVTAARRYLTDIYSFGVDRLLWDTEKRPLADSDAIAAVLAAARDGKGVDAQALAAALILSQSARLAVDRAEYELLEVCYTARMTDEAIAAVLELPDSAAAADRYQWLQATARYRDLGAG